MDIQLYFLKEDYYIDFPDGNLMSNKENFDGTLSKRPCYYAFEDEKNKNIKWLVPVSSKVEKYRSVQRSKIEKYGYCNTLCFGFFLGREAVFLIQNMCPSSDKYLEPYLNKYSEPVQIDGILAEEIVKKAKQVLIRTRKGSKIVFPDIMKIYEKLSEDLRISKNSKNFP